MELEINSQTLSGLTENYQYELVRFESKNPDKNEIDFLKIRIEKYRTLTEDHNKYLNFSNEDFLQLYKTENAEQIKGFLTEYTYQEVDPLIKEIHLERFKAQKTTPFRNGNTYVWFYENKLNKLLLANTNQSQQKETANKNLLLNGKDLNLSERFKIANKVLDIDKTLRKLNIKDLEKYKLLSYIMNCSEDNARHLMNGKYNSKDRDLTAFFNELNLNK